MNLLNGFISLIDEWKEGFYSEPTFKRGKDLAIGSLCAPFPHTLTSIISFIQDIDQGKDWSAYYYFYSRSKWEDADLFDPLIKHCTPYFDKSSYIVVAADDTTLKKTGKRIKTAFWQRDRLSPHFHPNLIWGIRFIQFSFTLPLYHFNRKDAPRGIPVRFIEAPIVKKPKKNAPKEEWEAFKKEKKINNLSIQCKNELIAFKQSLNFLDKPLLVTADGALCNKNFLRGNIHEHMHMVVRCRKDIVLCHQTKKPKNKQHFYDQKTFTPESIYKNQKIPWKKALIFRAGRYRMIKYKEMQNVFWRSVLKKQPLKLLVLKRIPYHPRKGRTNFRDPAFLLCIDQDIDSRLCIQSYHDHPQIELNFKEEKSLLGMGKAQVKNAKSVQRQPAFVCASYAALLLSSLKHPHLDIELPPWRKTIKRVGGYFLIKQLKKELLLQLFAIENYKPPPHMLKMLLKRAS